MAHHDRSNSECVIALPEKVGLSVSSARELHSVPMSTAREWLRKYRRDRQVAICKGTGLWRRFQSSSDAALAAEAKRNPFFSTRDLKDATGFRRQKDMIISRFNTAGLSARHGAVKQLLTDEHKLY